MRKKDELSKTHTCMQSAHPEEMVFVLLSRDAAAPVAIRAWAVERVRIGKNNVEDEQIVEALRCADVMKQEADRWKKMQENEKGEFHLFLIDDSERHWISARTTSEAISVYMEAICGNEDRLLSSVSFKVERLIDDAIVTVRAGTLSRSATAAEWASSGRGLVSTTLA